MSTSKFLYECWAFVKKMNRNTGITTAGLLTKMEQLGTVKSLHGTYIYSLMYSDRFDKLREIYEQFDNTFFMKEKGGSLLLQVARFKVLLKYNLPYESSLIELLPQLNTQISRTLLADLCQCLELIPSYRSQNFQTFILTIYSLIQQELDRTNILDNVFIITILRLVSRSAYRQPIKLQIKLTKILNSSISHMQSKQIFLISNLMMEKSSRVLWELMIRVDSDIVKRVISMQYMRKQWGRIFEEQMLPGKAAESEQEVQQAVKCVQSVLHRQPFLQVFPKRMFELQTENNKEMIKLWVRYVDYLYYHLKKQYYPLPVEVSIKFIRILSALLVKDGQKDLIGHINLLKLQVIVFDISRDAAVMQSVGDELKRIQTILKANLTRKYIQGHNFQVYQYNQLQYLSHYLLYQVVMMFSNNKESLEMEIIQAILNCRKERYKNKNFETIQQMIMMIKKGANISKNISILSSVNATEQDKASLIPLLPAPFANQITPSTTLLRTVIIAPNLQLSFLLADSKSTPIWAVDYDPILTSSSSYHHTTSLLPLSLPWKFQYLSHFCCPYLNLNH